MSNLSIDLLSEITQTAQKNGALLVGTTKIRRTEPVILFAFPFSDTWFFKQPISLSKSLGKQYLMSKQVQNLTAKILQSDGYRAEYKTVFSLFGDFRPLAVAAGLGQWGRNGLVVNKEHGSGLLFAGIFTNAPIEAAEPLTPDLLGITTTADEDSHCTACGQCIQACPADAFYDGRFHYSRCFPKAIQGCAECIKACTHHKRQQ